MRHICIATEDRLSEAVALRLIRDSGRQFCEFHSMGMKGKQDLRREVRKYLNMTKTMPVLMITDLDNDSCPADLRSHWFRRLSIPCKFLFRVAVRETEAWIMADREGFASFSNAPLPKVPHAPEGLSDPKNELLRLIRRYSPSQLKREMVADRGHGSFKQGSSYNPRLCDFVETGWDLDRASNTAPSLARARQRVRELAHNTP